MPTEPDNPLAQWPELDFPGRSMVSPHEIAAKWAVSLRHVKDLIEEGILPAADFAGLNRSDRRLDRIPISVYRRVTAERLARYGMPSRQPQPPSLF